VDDEGSPVVPEAFREVWRVFETALEGDAA
jgi:hypothetical protein